MKDIRRSRPRTGVMGLAGGAAMALLAGPVLGLAASPAAAAPQTGSGSAAHGQGHAPEVTVRRGGPARTVPFVVRGSGEAVVTLESQAPGVSWGTAGSESAVVSAYVDGRYATDIVIPADQPISRSFSLGRLDRGPHRLEFRFAADRSPQGARSARLGAVAVQVYGENTDMGLILRNAPVYYGRNLPGLGSAFQSATTDAPLYSYHEVLPAKTPGHRILQYTVIWTNEDGGTNSPALMARWGRTTDIEWAYDVEVDAEGTPVPGTGVYQAANHQTLVFAGAYEGNRPRLETCTSNNNLCDTVDDPMRFSPAPVQELPAGQPREHMMDVNPWLYPVMAQEMAREGKIESPSDPATPQLGDQRTYLYLAVAHTATPSTDAGSVGLSIGVRLKGDPTLYRSNHVDPTWSITREGTAATTVELPAGTTQSDIAQIVALRTPVAETGASLTVTAVTRAFFLQQDYLPSGSFADWTGSAVLTPDAPEATLWQAAG
ncbi:hypothetical protein NMG29_00870 [Streptomyces cocklensis]|uniref:Uncharacterized protein n=1 Tax=Actinacidiphila cocklensis TaxID=887465 RepID=A0A9W4DXJ8_9ACTN|nr:hypothetical protein [Actinacidiphila cocklensis]MDD1056801.1 hypothetical protein [Actinacidiphila cocklensis]CAG6397718.1 conserved exported hypothetical protein [Actinacidiphila cocklensis]